jgi:tRNA dimethylallyltransferase
MNNNNLIVILGPTATGKTQLAAQLAHQVSGEVISADSRQVYKGMDIGTGKDLSDFNIDGDTIPYHLIDIVEAGEEYNVFEFQKDFLTAYKDIVQRNKLPILCGGTGMYLESILKGYRLLPIPEDAKYRKELELQSLDELVRQLKTYKYVHNTTDTVDKKRLIKAIEIAKFNQENESLIKDFPNINYQLYGIYFEREELKKRITKRLKHRFKQQSMIEEVEQLIKHGVSPDKLKYYGLEYKLITQYLLKEITRLELFEKLNIAIHQFSKRQSTWFRKMERNGFEINWIDGNLSLDEKLNIILSNKDE